MYGGAVGKGVAWFILGFFLFLFGLATLGLGILIGFPVWLINLVDAYNTAKKFNLQLLQSIEGET